MREIFPAVCVPRHCLWQTRYGPSTTCIFPSTVEVQSVSLGTVVLGANHETLEARWVNDCRGWAQLQGPLGYQKFLGLELEFAQEQKLQVPIIKDARVAQTDGNRFMYVLPFSFDSFSRKGQN